MKKIQLFEKPCQELRDVEEQVKDSHLGFVYACQYGDHIKIGSTSYPYKRYMTFVREGSKYNNSKIGNFAISGAHTNYRENERLLHKEFANARVKGTELFNIDFETASEKLKTIVLRDDSEQLERNSIALKNGFANFIMGRSKTLSFTNK